MAALSPARVPESFLRCAGIIGDARQSVERNLSFLTVSSRDHPRLRPLSYAFLSQERSPRDHYPARLLPPREAIADHVVASRDPPAGAFAVPLDQVPSSPPFAARNAGDHPPRDVMNRNFDCRGPPESQL